jgi:mRNA interferase RelE/StbE
MRNRARDCNGHVAASFNIELKPLAVRAFKKLPEEIQKRIAEAIDGLSANPYPSVSKKKRGIANFQGIPIGCYRVIYQVQPRTRIVLVLWIGHHQEDFHKSKFWNKLRKSA